MKLFEIIFLWIGSAALRVDNQPADGKRTYTVSVQALGKYGETGKLPFAVAKNGAVKADLSLNIRIQLLGESEGEFITVGTSSDNYSACSYKVGQMMTTCFIGKQAVTFSSQEEVGSTLKMGLLVTKNGQGNESPFEVNIDNVTIWTESGPIDPDTTWWRIIDVDGAGAVVKLLFTSIDKQCTYTVASGNDKQTCEIDGWSTDFETMESTPFIGDPLTKLKRAPTSRWSVHLHIEGSGPNFDIDLNHDKKYMEKHDGPVSFVRLFDAFIGERVIFRFANDEEYYYTVGDTKQTFVNLKGFTIEMETILKSET